MHGLDTRTEARHEPLAGAQTHALLKMGWLGVEVPPPPPETVPMPPSPHPVPPSPPLPPEIIEPPLPGQHVPVQEPIIDGVAPIQVRTLS